MALPVVSSRPEKTVNSVLSRWNAANLPLIYDLTNTKWPVNTDDTSTDINTVNANNGFAKLSTPTPLSPLPVAKEWVFVSGTTDYNGPHQIRSVTANTITIDFPFIDSQTGTVIKYYNNYTTVARIYAGIDPAHAHAAEKPIALVATIEQLPNEDNSTFVNAQEFVKSKLNTDYDLSQTSWPNDLNAWADFYISFAERYDNVSSGVVEDFISAFTNDTDIEGIIYLKATHAAQQFGYEFGGNMGEYLIDDNPYSSGAKWLTFFERSKLIDFNSFNLSIISELTPFDLNFVQYDRNDNVLATDQVVLQDEGYGVYRLPLDGFQFITSVSYVTIQASVGNFAVSVTHTIDIDPGCTTLPAFVVREWLLEDDTDNSDVWLLEDGTSWLLENSD